MREVGGRSTSTAGGLQGAGAPAEMNTIGFGEHSGGAYATWGSSGLPGDDIRSLNVMGEWMSRSPS